MRGKSNTIETFWSFVDKTPTCWLWLGGGVDKTGYGRFSYKGGFHYVHRFSYSLHTNRDIPDEVNVCHKCDIRLCVNPEHLFLGTDSDNMKDMIAKGRSDRKGDKSHYHKLTRADVDLIRNSYTQGLASRHELAEMFNVSWSCITDVILQ